MMRVLLALLILVQIHHQMHVQDDKNMEVIQMKTKKSKDLLIATMKELQDKETMKINGGRWPLGCNGAWFVLNRPRTPPVGVGCARR